MIKLEIITNRWTKKMILKINKLIEMNDKKARRQYKQAAK